MADITERLRDKTISGQIPAWVGEEAADEIERLRAALADCVATLEACAEALPDWSSMQRYVTDSLALARAALAGTAETGAVAHVHNDECWEPDSGCDMGRNEKYVRRMDHEEAAIMDRALRASTRPVAPASDATGEASQDDVQDFIDDMGAPAYEDDLTVSDTGGLARSARATLLSPERQAAARAVAPADARCPVGDCYLPAGHDGLHRPEGIGADGRLWRVDDTMTWRPVTPASEGRGFRMGPDGRCKRCEGYWSNHGDDNECPTVQPDAAPSETPR